MTERYEPITDPLFEIRYVVNLLVQDGWSIFDILDVCHDVLDKEMADFDCLACGVNTCDIGNYYMIHDHLWESVNPGGKGMMCFDCVESKLGRTLTIEDFTDAPINEEHLSNPRFQLRTAA